MRYREDDDAAAAGSPQVTKTVVFSYFTRALDMLEAPLRGKRLPFLRLDGSMSLKQRAEVVRGFSNDLQVQDLLVCNVNNGLPSA